MIWIEKYKPKSFAEITTHSETIDILSKYTLSNMPNLIIHGQVGHNKKTVLYSLIAQLYGKYPNPQVKSSEIEAGSTSIPVTYLESNEMIEICPSEYGYKDRFVMQSIIKDMAEVKPIFGLFGSVKNSVRILVIDQAEDLSKDAQAALRRTIEIYSDHFRVVMLCTETSKLIDPIRSRCLMIRMRGFKDDELHLIAENILKKENFTVSADIIDELCVNSAGDCKRFLCLLELYCFNSDTDQVKKLKVDYSKFKLEWESKIENVVNLIRNNPKPETMADIRKEFYSLLSSQIPANVILLHMMREITAKSSFEFCKTISSFALGYEERIKLGSKHLYHLEAFAAACMLAQIQKK
jgi:replication factor C subunit 3/5